MVSVQDWVASKRHEYLYQTSYTTKVFLEGWVWIKRYLTKPCHKASLDKLPTLVAWSPYACALLQGPALQIYSM